MDNKMDNKTASPSKAKARFKKKGPVRLEAVIPIGVIAGLTSAYFLFFFDLHLRKGLEWAGTQGNGAEVDVGSLKTSFINGTLLIQGIEVTNPETPALNRIEINTMRFQFVWDALLRGKFVVPVASIENIQVNTTRKSPGKVLPPPPPKKEPEGESWFGKMKAQATARAQEEFSKSPLADASKMLEGFDPTKQLKDIGNLKSKEKIEQMIAQLGQKQTEWNSTLNSLPGDKDVADLQGKINSMRVGGTNNPAELAQQITQFTGVINEAKNRVETVKTQGENLVKDVNGFSNSVQEIEELVKKDTADLENRLQLPRLDAKNLAEQLFGKSILNKVAEAQDYIALARKYMPAGGSAKAKPQEKATPPKRGVGKNYAFGTPKGYPKFWLKKAEVTSKAENSPFGGDVQGQILDVTTDPAMIGRPAIASIKGNFPKQQLQGILAQITLDHTQEVAVDSLKMQVAYFPVSQKMFSDSPEMKFGIGSAEGTAGLEGVVKGDTMSLTAESTFRKIGYQVQSNSKLLESTLQGVVKDIPTVSVKAKVHGPWANPQLTIDSNLASALQRGFEKQLQAKLAEARKKIDELINGQIGAKKKELTDKVDGVKAQLTAQVEDKKRKLTEIQNQGQAKIAAVQNQADAIKRQAEEAARRQAEAAKGHAVDAARKKFGF